jgi:hypothetical protein
MWLVCQLVLSGHVHHLSFYSFVSAITNYHKLDGLKIIETYSLTVLQTRSLKSKYWQGRLSSKTLGDSLP